MLLTTTADRRVLGNMNDFAVQAEFAIVEAGGIGACDAAAVGRYLRRVPFGRGGQFASAASLLSLEG